MFLSMPSANSRGFAHGTKRVNSLPNNNFLDWSKLKALRRKNKCNFKTEILVGISRKQKMLEKEKMLVHSIFSFSHNVYKMPFIKGGYCVVKS